jgi:hypothetical protein
MAPEAPAPFSPALIARLEWLAAGARPHDPGSWAREQRVDLLLEASRRDAARERHATALVRWTIVLDHLASTLAILDAARVPGLVLKGAALDLLHYPSPVFRPMDDIDVLVAPADRHRANEALVRAGCRSTCAADHATSYVTPDGRGTVELHHTLVSCGRLFALPFGSLWDRRQSLAPAIEGWTLGDEDMLVHLSIHAAFQHGFALRLNQYLDFERLRVLGTLRADEVARIARAADALPSVAASGLVAQRLWGATEEAPLADHVPPKVRRWVAALASRPWDLAAGLPLGQARWHLIPGVRRKLALIRATLAPGDRISAWGVTKRIVRLATSH